MDMQRFKDYFDLVKKQAAGSAYHGVVRQIAEMVVVFVVRKIGPGFYLMAEMNKKEYGWAYKLGFLNGREYIKRVREINNPDYLSVTFNKLVEKALLNQYAMPTPRFYGYLQVKRGINRFGGSLKNAKDLRALIDQSQLKKICFKLVAGLGGKGFRAIEVVSENEKLVLKDIKSQTLYTPEEFCQNINLENGIGYVVEQYFDQHSEMNRLNSSSVNTLRISVYQKPGEQPICYGAFLRMGRHGEIVDNTMSGGIAAKVNLESGILCSGVEFSSRKIVYSSHPDSGCEIEGFRVPLFEEARSLACTAIQVLPEIYYAGVDVAIGPDGPSIIEFNAMADYSDFAIVNEPSRPILKQTHR